MTEVAAFQRCSIAEITYYTMYTSARVFHPNAVSRGDVLIGLWAVRGKNKNYKYRKTILYGLGYHTPSLSLSVSLSVSPLARARLRHCSHLTKYPIVSDIYICVCVLRIQYIYIYIVQHTCRSHSDRTVIVRRQQ